MLKIFQQHERRFGRINNFVNSMYLSKILFYHLKDFYFLIISLVLCALSKAV